MTGILICAISLDVYLFLSSARKRVKVLKGPQVASPRVESMKNSASLSSVHQNKGSNNKVSASDKSLRLLIERLAVLGMATVAFLVCFLL